MCSLCGTICKCGKPLAWDILDRRFYHDEYEDSEACPDNECCPKELWED